MCSWVKLANDLQFMQESFYYYNKFKMFYELSKCLFKFIYFYKHSLKIIIKSITNGLLYFFFKISIYLQAESSRFA